MNPDWPEISRQLLGFIHGLISGLSIMAFRNYFEIRKLKRKLSLDVFLENVRASYPEEDSPIIRMLPTPTGHLTLRVTNIGKSPVTLIDGGFYAEGENVKGFDWEFPKKILESDPVEYKYNFYEDTVGEFYAFKYGWVKLSTGEIFKIQISPDKIERI